MNHGKSLHQATAFGRARRGRRVQTGEPPPDAGSVAAVTGLATSAFASGDGHRQVAFQLCAEPGSAVYVAGTFNDWNPQEIRLEDSDSQGLYRTSLRLPKGRHEYKFIVNGQWCVDPECPASIPSPLGSVNSVIDVP